MAWKTYDLDKHAQKLVLAARKRHKDSLNQAFKMRAACAYGLERFWGEQLRLQNDADKAKYWGDTWKVLVEILSTAGLKLPNDPATGSNVESMAQKLWSLPLEDQRQALAVLTQLCDCMVWWTQRYKQV